MRGRWSIGQPRSSARVTTVVIFIALVTLSLVTGCKSTRTRSGAPTAAGQGELQAGMAAIAAGNPDAAMARADQYLSVNRTGAGAAEAYYLRGRAFELRAQRDAAGAPRHLQDARVAYIEALRHAPDRELEAYVRSQLGNVAYFQDDYQTAAGQLTFAAQNLPNPEDRAWAMYRSGIAQQRLGRFALADRVFAQVQSRHPNTEPARRAREHAGVKTFGVQLAAYTDPGRADALVAGIRAQGLTAARTTNAKGQHVVSVVNLASFDDAKRTRARFAAEYPDAVLIP